MLKILNDKFLNSTLKTKIELYILPALFIFLFYTISQNDTKSNVYIESKVNLDYSKIEFKESFLELFSNLEEYALNNQIQILTLTNNKKMLSIKVKTNFENIEKLIQRIENLNNFTDIKIFKMNKYDIDMYIVELEIDLSKFYIKKLTKEEKIAENIIEYKLKAIIFDYVFINDMWLRKSEKIDDFELKQIGRNFVLLQNNTKNIRLELNNEYIENFN